MTTHKISWLNMPGYKPETWNPIIGCSKVSPGCDNCYAEKMAIRLSYMPDFQISSDYKLTLLPGNDNKPSGWNDHTIFREEYLLHPKRWKSPRMVFVCSMSDLFHENNDFDTIKKVYETMHSNDQHIFIVLTKRPERMYKFWVWLLDKVAGLGIQDVSSTTKDNVWIGVTAENQEQANKRIPILLQIPANKRFVSIEPMLESIDLNRIPAKYWGEEYDDLYNGLSLSALDGGKDTPTPWHLDWVICGGESGHKARPMHPDWVRSVRDQCKEAGTPFLFKQWGEWGEVPDYGSQKGKICFNSEGHHQWIPSVKGYSTMKKVGRTISGDLLDGKQHHEWPKINL